MDRLKVVVKSLATPLQGVANIVGKYPKGALIAWSISLCVVAWLF